MIIDTKRLRERAEAADDNQPGPWTATERVDGEWVIHDRDCTWVARLDDASAECAAFIAAANPQTVIALLDEIERLRELSHEIHGIAWAAGRHEIEQQLAAMTTERDELRAACIDRHNMAADAGNRADILAQQLAAMTAARDEACVIAAKAVEVAHDESRAGHGEWRAAFLRIVELRKVGA